MHLIDTTTLELHEFYGDKTPSYAILSHRWEDGEVSYKEFRKRRNPEKQGWNKIKSFCKLAREDGYAYVWVDTCCIDKSSSAELQEAINSMFNWYRAAGLCYAYLSDVPEDDEVEAPNSAFRQSQWFTRGWTLQELLAPTCLIFISKEWNCFGSRKGLSYTISDITGIPCHLLSNFYSFGTESFSKDPMDDCSIADVMFWAAKRKTTRPEDTAYCLLGLFGVQLPLLYGEGNKAFRRLQIQLIDAYDDDSIYVWNATDTEDTSDYRHENLSISGLVASSPADFAFSRNITFINWDYGHPLDRITSRGVETKRPMLSLRNFDMGDIFLLPLNCGIIGDHMPLMSEDVFQVYLPDDEDEGDQNRPPENLACVLLRKNEAGSFNRFHIQNLELATRMDAKFRMLARDRPPRSDLTRYSITVHHVPKIADVGISWEEDMAEFILGSQSDETLD